MFVSQAYTPLTTSTLIFLSSFFPYSPVLHDVVNACSHMKYTFVNLDIFDENNPTSYHFKEIWILIEQYITLHVE